MIRWWVRSFSLAAVAAIPILVAACRVHDVCERPLPPVEIPDAYCNTLADEDAQNTLDAIPWWENFADPQLDAIVEAALDSNLDLAQAFDRLSQARAAEGIAGSRKFFDLYLRFGTSHNRVNDLGTDIPFNFSASITRYFLQPVLSYEVDIWRRADSAYRAASYDTVTACEDAQATALTLTGAVTDLWLMIQEQAELEALLYQQLEVNRTLLDLVELRFQLGISSALDVYQQRQTLKAVEVDLPVVQSALDQAKQQLNILLGRSPCDDSDMVSSMLLPELPPLPQIGSPCHLLEARPDIRGALASVTAADYEVASAIADRFPRWDLTLSYEFSATAINEFFNREVGEIVNGFLMPLIDHNRRYYEVERRRAIVCERVNRLGQVYLDALGEVEGALTAERYQLEQLQYLYEQEQISEANLIQATARNANGLVDYLTVIAAIQTLQNVQRQLIIARRDLLANRAVLYRALGGCWWPGHCVGDSCCETYEEVL